MFRTNKLERLSLAEALSHAFAGMTRASHGAVFTTLHFLHNIQMLYISKSGLSLGSLFSLV
jgi:hypothetical protein